MGFWTPCYLVSRVGYSRATVRLFFRLEAALVLFAYVLTCGAGGSWVLCFGADGHVTLEAAGATCCLNERSSAMNLLESCTTLEAASGCGACTDIPLVSTESARVGPLELLTCSAAAAAVSLLPAPGFLADTSLVARASKPPAETFHPDRALSHLRTVVLLR